MALAGGIVAERDKVLDRARTAFGRRAWEAAYAGLVAADSESPIHADDLERLAIAAHLTGREEESADAWGRAHQDWLQVHDEARAVRCAFWLGTILLERGEQARGGGWLARAGRILADLGGDHVEEGYLLLPAGLQALITGDGASALAQFRRAAELGERFEDLDLETLARHGEGRTLIQLGETERGAALLDEVMIAVTADEVSILVTGIVYCSVIEACRQMFDLRRAQEWTAALDRWSDAQPDLVVFRGQCLVYRAEIMELSGEWPEASDEAGRAVERLSHPTEQPALGTAHYQRAELHRLRGAFVEAERDYRLASRHGRPPEPGLALLRLAQGQVEAAAAAMRSALTAPRERNERADFLAAYVEVLLAAGDLAAAHEGAGELAAIAASIEAPWLTALAARAQGVVELADGRAREALGALRRSLAAWQTLDARYEAARTRVAIARACQAMGDQDTADLELEAAVRVFQQLGAAPDLLEAESRATGDARQPLTPLTGRELEVLRLVASGKTNRAIADDLVISEKTVARHVSNIFAKLELSSRAAATAYAYEHRLV